MQEVTDRSTLGTGRAQTPGILSTVQQVANALGVALIGNLFHNETGGAAAARPVIRRRGRAGPGNPV